MQLLDKSPNYVKLRNTTYKYYIKIMYRIFQKQEKLQYSYVAAINYNLVKVQLTLLVFFSIVSPVQCILFYRVILKHPEILLTIC